MSNTSRKKGEPMRRMRKGLSALVLAICLLMSIALGGKALADNDGWVPDAGGNGGSNSLKVLPAGETTEEEYVNDLLSADVVVDVFKMADAVESTTSLTYTYTLEGAFAPLQDQLDACIERTEEKKAAQSREEWEAFAEAAAGKASSQGGTAKIETADGVTISGLQPGLYLVMPHGKGSSAEDPLIAQSKTYEYSFNPIVIAIPTKDDVDGDGIAMTSVEDGEWIFNPTIVLKSSRESLFGSVLINKTLPEKTDGKKATFVFHIRETDESAAGKDTRYDEYASVYYNGTTADPALVTKIPAGIDVEITEVDAGPRYTIDTTVYTRTIVADDGTIAGAGVSVTFDNKPNGNNFDGYGIENHFEYDETQGWVLRTIPKQETSESGTQQ